MKTDTLKSFNNAEIEIRKAVNAFIDLAIAGDARLSGSPAWETELALDCTYDRVYDLIDKSEYIDRCQLALLIESRVEEIREIFTEEGRDADCPSTSELRSDWNLTGEESSAELEEMVHDWLSELSSEKASGRDRSALDLYDFE